jgi:hypothetical protein
MSINKYLIFLLFCFVILSCKSQKTCEQFLNFSKYQINQDTICSKLTALQKINLGLSIYVNDSIPLIVERDNIFHSLNSNIDKRAIVFINLKNREFEIMYSNSLKDNQHLKDRYDFMHLVNDYIKNENHTEFILNIIDSFTQKFGLKSF